jgi:hypothetical protein
MKQEMEPIAKHILLALAVRANENHQCWPCRKTTAGDTDYLSILLTAASAISSETA